MRWVPICFACAPMLVRACARGCKRQLQHTTRAGAPCQPQTMQRCSPPPSLGRFWDTRAGKNTATVTTPGANLYLAWSPDAHYLAVANRDDVVSIIDARWVLGTAAFRGAGLLVSVGEELRAMWRRPSRCRPQLRAASCPCRSRALQEVAHKYPLPSLALCSHPLLPRSKMKVAHKYPFKYQVNDLGFSKDGSKLYICTGNGEQGAVGAKQPCTVETGVHRLAATCMHGGGTADACWGRKTSCRTRQLKQAIPLPPPLPQRAGRWRCTASPTCGECMSSRRTPPPCLRWRLTASRSGWPRAGRTR